MTGAPRHFLWAGQDEVERNMTARRRLDVPQGRPERLMPRGHPDVTELALTSLVPTTMK